MVTVSCYLGIDDAIETNRRFFSWSEEAIAFVKDDLDNNHLPYRKYAINHEIFYKDKFERYVKELKIGDSVSFGGYVWSKFRADENGNAYMLADFSPKGPEFLSFGNTNIWGLSPLREKCFELEREIKKEFGSDSLIEFETDLLSTNGDFNYGKTKDRVSLLTVDMLRKNPNIKEDNDYYWLATPSNMNRFDGMVTIARDGDYIECTMPFYSCSFRPFCILNAEILLP